MASVLDAYFAPKKEIPRRAYLTVSVLTAAVILLLWCALSYGNVVRRDFLPTPDEVVTAAVSALADGSLMVNTGVSVTEIMSGFIIASIFAVPLGILEVIDRRVVARISAEGHHPGRWLRPIGLGHDNDAHPAFGDAVRRFEKLDLPVLVDACDDCGHLVHTLAAEPAGAAGG